MAGGLMQLVAYGAQDIYLTGNPQITFFKIVYRRYTNFSMECIEQTINGISTLTSSSNISNVTISRNGDLVSGVYVTSNTSGIENGDEIVNEVELEIGGQKIDKHTKEWMQIWAELTTPESKALAYKNMTGALSHGNNSTGSIGVNMVQIPLQFWFCRNPGLALPLIALQYHEVKLNLKLGTNTDVGANASIKVWADYIYLDTEERRRFAQVSHEYLIEQLQFNSLSGTISNPLNFNHPVKELVWTSANTNSYGTARLILNGVERFSEQEEEYFQLRQPFQYHTAVPGANIPMSDRPVNLSTPLMIVQKRLCQVASGVCDATNMVKVNSDAGGNGTVIDIFANPGETTNHGAQELYSAGTGAASTATSTIKVKVGDVILVTISDADNTTATGTPRIIVASVTDVSTTGNTTRLTTTHKDIESGVNDCYDTLATDAISIAVISSLQDSLSRCSQLSKKINCYSFSLNPEEHQPSGTCNFSRIDSAILETNSSLTSSDNIYAVNYNVLRVMSGMGGLAYSN